ncbi:MAG TPA: protein translocase subunit SecD [Thermoanaerobaculia bacterium]|nr:protein translocase subunit SecD [Thermoanaerobaculia bacterium]
MNRNIWWKVALIIGLMVLFIAPLIPQRKNEERIPLGLDLKGGTHLVMQVNTGDAVRAEVDQAMEFFKAQVTKQSLPAPVVRRVSENSFIAVPQGGASMADYEKIGRDWLGQFDVTQQPEGVQFAIKESGRSQLEDDTVNQAMETIRNRVDALGVTEPVIARQGGVRGKNIVIQLPGVDDPARVKEIIKTTAQLQFRIVEEIAPGQPATGPDAEALLQSLPAPMRNDVDILPGDSQDAFGRVSGKMFYAVRKSVPVTGRDLKTARVDKGRLGEPIISFSLTPDGGRKFAALTGANINRGLAIVLDNKVKSAPNINSQIEDQGIIEGRFTQQESSDLALILRSGALPASMTTLEERTVGPSLGSDSIRAGVTAALIGFALLILTVIVYYRGAGINAVIALFLNLIILLGMMAYFRATLTLPGIAGIILTLGMAIDSNVLVFERIREELREGKTVRAAIDNGFSRAFGTIIDTHLTTIISALFLFQFGTGPIKGFAVTLLIGLAASVFTAFFVSRVIFDITYKPVDRPQQISI